jgi:hypothetical protein
MIRSYLETEYKAKLTENESNQCDIFAFSSK